MNKFALERLITIEMDPYFFVELIILFFVTVFNFYFIKFFGIPMGVFPLTGYILESIYFTYVIILIINIFMFANSLENGKILTFVSFGYNLRRVLISMFLWSVIYPALLITLVFSINVYIFEFMESLAGIAEFLYYLLSFSILAVGAGFFVTSLIKNPIISSGSILFFFIFISTNLFASSAKNNPLYFALTGFYSISYSHPFSSVFVYGGIIEIVLGLIMFLASVVIIRRRSLKAMRR